MSFFLAVLIIICLTAFIGVHVARMNKLIKKLKSSKEELDYALLKRVVMSDRINEMESGIEYNTSVYYVMKDEMLKLDEKIHFLVDFYNLDVRNYNAAVLRMSGRMSLNIMNLRNGAVKWLRKE